MNQRVETFVMILTHMSETHTNLENVNSRYTIEPHHHNNTNAPIVIQEQAQFPNEAATKSPRCDQVPTHQCTDGC